MGGEAAKSGLSFENGRGGVGGCKRACFGARYLQKWVHILFISCLQFRSGGLTRFKLEKLRVFLFKTCHNFDKKTVEIMTR